MLFRSAIPSSTNALLEGIAISGVEERGCKDVANSRDLVPTYSRQTEHKSQDGLVIATRAIRDVPTLSLTISEECWGHPSSGAREG